MRDIAPRFAVHYSIFYNSSLFDIKLPKATVNVHKVNRKTVTGARQYHSLRRSFRNLSKAVILQVVAVEHVLQV